MDITTHLILRAFAATGLEPRAGVTYDPHGGTDGRACGCALGALALAFGGCTTDDLAEAPTDAAQKALNLDENDLKALIWGFDRGITGASWQITGAGWQPGPGWDAICDAAYAAGRALREGRA